jgi:AmiR/NasT family two-component response regulator
MAATGVDRDAAFQLLLKQSQSSNRKLRDIASDLVAQHVRRSMQPRNGQPSR